MEPPFHMLRTLAWLLFPWLLLYASLCSLRHELTVKETCACRKTYYIPKYKAQITLRDLCTFRHGSSDTLLLCFIILLIFLPVLLHFASSLPPFGVFLERQGGHLFITLYRLLTPLSYRFLFLI